MTNGPFHQIDEIEAWARSQITHALSTAQLEEIRLYLMGKKGKVASLMVHLRELSSEDKPLFGARVNTLKELCESLLDQAKATLTKGEQTARFEKERLDITLPGRALHTGQAHPITQFINRALSIMEELGFASQRSPELDTSYYNYEGLNFPENHPARDMQDTFYIDSERLLRSHTTTIWQHLFAVATPPIRVTNAGKVFRNETVSARSHVIFHQLDVLYVDENVTFRDLLGTMQLFYSKLFGRQLDIRWRPSYFPFVEPGIEVDVHCVLCDGKGCTLCKKTGWLEVCGGGMVHPNCLKEGGLDPERYSGFAWGMGIERTLMLCSKVDDIRLFWENDQRFLSQFSAG